MQSSFTDIIQELQTKDPSMASDFILSHKLLEYIWYIHFSGSRFIMQGKNEKLFFPITLLVLPSYIRLYQGDTNSFQQISKTLQGNKDFRFLEGSLGGDLASALEAFIKHYYREYLFSVDEDIYESEVKSIIEYDQHALLKQYNTPQSIGKYRQIKGRYIPTIESLKVFLRKLYDHGGIKIVQDYLNQPYYGSDNTNVQKYIQDHFQFHTKRGYGGNIETKYQSLALHGDGSLIINIPYTGYGKVSVGKNTKLYHLFRDLLKSYPRGVRVSEKYSTIFGYSRTQNTPYAEKILLWKKRVELKVLQERYSPASGFLKIENEIITLQEIAIPE